MNNSGKNYVNIQYGHYLTYADCQRTVICCSSFLSFFFFFTNNEALSAVGTSYSVIPQNLMYKEGTNKSRNEIIQEILSNNPCRKKKKRQKRKDGQHQDAGLVELFKMKTN